MYQVMYQVIVIFEGEWHHEGFFEDIRQAEEHKDRLSERLYIGTDSEEYSVFINEIKIQNLQQ